MLRVHRHRRRPGVGGTAQDRCRQAHTPPYRHELALLAVHVQHPRRFFLSARPPVRLSRVLAHRSDDIRWPSSRRRSGGELLQSLTPPMLIPQDFEHGHRTAITTYRRLELTTTTQRRTEVVPGPGFGEFVVELPVGGGRGAVGLFGFLEAAQPLESGAEVVPGAGFTVFVAELPVGGGRGPGRPPGRPLRSVRCPRWPLGLVRPAPFCRPPFTGGAARPMRAGGASRGGRANSFGGPTWVNNYDHREFRNN